GLAFLVLFAQYPGYPGPGPDIGAWGDTSYPLIIQSWPGLALIALVYCFGFRWYYVVGLAAYLAVMGFQGFHRFRILIPVVLITQIWLDQQGRRWPKLLPVAMLTTVFLLFFPLKTVGHMLQDNTDPSKVLEVASDQIKDSFRGDAPDQLFLDEFATNLT